MVMAGGQLGRALVLRHVVRELSEQRVFLQLTKLLITDPQHRGAGFLLQRQQIVDSHGHSFLYVGGTCRSSHTCKALRRTCVSCSCGGLLYPPPARTRKLLCPGRPRG